MLLVSVIAFSYVDLSLILSWRRPLVKSRIAGVWGILHCIFSRNRELLNFPCLIGRPVLGNLLHWICSRISGEAQSGRKKFRKAVS